MPGREEVPEREAVGDEIVDLLAERFPDDSKHALCLRLQYAVPLIRNQERQRIQEALLNDNVRREIADIAANNGDAEDIAKLVIKLLAARLATLDPSKEVGRDA